MRGVFSFLLFFCSTHCHTLSIYNGRIQGHVNRLNHVQSVFAPPTLSRSHTLSHTPSLSLALTALPHCLLLSLSLPLSHLCRCLFLLPLSHVFPLRLPLYPLHTCIPYTGERLSLSLIPSPAVSCSSRPSHPITFVSLSPVCTQSLHTATLTWSSLCLSPPSLLSSNRRLN